MASKVYDRTKITVYPDHSTLCEAFRAHRNRPDAADCMEYRPLRDWFERVAREANLCLSMVHLVELAGWGDEATADEMAHWYSSLPIVWVPMIDAAERFEQEQWTKVAAGVEVDLTEKPFAPSFLSSFSRIGQDGIAALLAAREPEFAMMRAARSDRWRELWRTRYVEPFIANLVWIAMNHHAHRAMARWTEQMGRDDVTRNTRNAIRGYAYQADLRLRRAQDPAYASRECTSEAVPQLLVDLYESDPRALPLQRLGRAFNDGAIARMERGQIDAAGQPSNNLRRSLSSSFGDYIHLVGAAYCDVFTCDGPVSEWIGGLRESFGHPRPQFAVQGYDGGTEAFVRDLMASWP